MKTSQPSAWEMPPCTRCFHRGTGCGRRDRYLPELRAGRGSGQWSGGHPPGGGGNPVGRVMLSPGRGPNSAAFRLGSQNICTNPGPVSSPGMGGHGPQLTGRSEGHRPRVCPPQLPGAPTSSLGQMLPGS